MHKQEIYTIINEFAPYETAEEWDCSGWIVETTADEIKKIMLCLTVTDEAFEQAVEMECDMIISHHPLFYVPLKYKNINILCAHTNLDKAQGGTTDTLIDKMSLSDYKISCNSENENEADYFIRYVLKEYDTPDFVKLLSQISPNLRYVNNKNIKKLKKIAFCAGSGADFIEEAAANGADAFVTGDIKFHTALDSKIVLFDIGHFESEIFVLEVLEKLLSGAEIIRAKEKSPFIHKQNPL